MSKSLAGRLRIWGNWLNRELGEAGMPPANASPPSWTRQIKSEGEAHTSMEPDEEEMEAIERAWQYLRRNDSIKALVLKWHYRDRVLISADRLKAARAGLKKYLS